MTRRTSFHNLREAESATWVCSGVCRNSHQGDWARPRRAMDDSHSSPATKDKCRSGPVRKHRPCCCPFVNPTKNPTNVCAMRSCTGGHITACAEVLKPPWLALKVFAVEPTLSSVLSGGTHSPHSI